MTNGSALQDKNTNKVALPELDQVYIEEIFRHLDLKSAVRLQLTCRALFQKCLSSQRRIICPLWIHYRGDGNLKFHLRGGPSGVFNEEEFRRSNFKFKAIMIIHDDVTLDVVNRITATFRGRGVIERLSFKKVVWARGADPTPFNQLIQQFKVSSLEIGRRMPTEFFQLPAVKQLKYLGYSTEGRGFHHPLKYLLETEIHSCHVTMDYPRGRHMDSGEMHDIIQKWTKREKVVKHFFIRCFNWNEERLFFPWTVINEGEEIPHQRPIVVREATEERFSVIRSDGARLQVKRIGMDSVNVATVKARI